jgi:hypothetical protein
MQAQEPPQEVELLLAEVGLIMFAQTIPGRVIIFIQELEPPQEGVERLLRLENILLAEAGSTMSGLTIPGLEQER